MSKQLIPAVKGTRDFYPEDMAFRNWLYGKIKKVSEKFGYQEFDGPNIEYLDLYADKTSEEILKDQAFSLKDRDGRDILLRPEVTPTFARMVAQKSQELPKPIRWFSFGRCYRYEQPQKGRTREFFQWEINILGPETPEADAEIIALAAEYFKELGLTPDEVVIRVSDRSYFQQLLDSLGISELLYMPILRLIDRVTKISEEEFTSELVNKLKLTAPQLQGIRDYIKEDRPKSNWLIAVFKSLETYPGVLNYVVYDPSIARGFDYYTRTVFEAWDKTGQLKRALFGGGRFDNLTETLGGDRIPGVGMAPGDVPIQVVLEQFGKMPDVTPKTAKVLVTKFGDDFINEALKLSNTLREKGMDVEVWLSEESKLDRQLKYADEKRIPFAVIMGPDEIQNGTYTLKDLKSKTQETLSLDELVEKLSD